MDKPILGDPELFPDESVLAAHLGRAKAAYAELFELCRGKRPDFEGSWNFYRDGKSWLMKGVSKKKTLFWLSAGDGFFKTTFYIGTINEEAVEGAGLPEELLAQYRASTGKKFRGLTLVVTAKKDLALFEKLLAIKMAAR